MKQMTTLQFFFRLSFVLATIAGILALLVTARRAAAPRYVTIAEKR